MSTIICATCGAHFSGEPARCPICEDARQWVPAGGQRWTTPEALAAEHRCEVRRDGDYVGVGVEPEFAIGQRALVVDGVLWDCVPLVAAEEAVGSLRAIAISHPHYYTGMAEWAHEHGCPVLLHADDAEWITRPDPAIELWEGETRDLGGGLTLVRCGGHFAGATVLHDAGRGNLLAGDIVQVVPDLAHVGFMYSYPNLVPLPAASVRAIAAALEPYAFERIYGAWWGRIVPRDGSAVVARSAERYVRALEGELP